MSDGAERLLNLALLIAGSRRPVSAEECRSSGIGYSKGQDDDAFARMFERDKDALRSAGLPIVVVSDGDTEAYALDPAAYAAPLDMSAEETATLGAVGAAMRSDASFPLAEDLRFALAKLAPSAESSAPPVLSRLADEEPAAQGAAAAMLSSAVSARKRVSFEYVTADGRGGAREVEPYGLYLREGRWYVVGRDVSRDALRTFTVARMSGIRVDPARPKSPDFERPAGLDIAALVALPFQYGPPVTEAVVRFGPDAAWRAQRLCCGQGALTEMADGSVEWSVPVADEPRLLRWIVENGPGIEPVAPPSLRAALVDGLRSVVSEHGA